MRGQSQSKKKCFQKIFIYYINKGDCSPKYTKGLLNLNSKNKHPGCKNGRKDLNKHLIKIHRLSEKMMLTISCGKGKLKQQGDTTVLHRSVVSTIPLATP